MSIDRYLHSCLFSWSELY